MGNIFTRSTNHTSPEHILAEHTSPEHTLIDPLNVTKAELDKLLLPPLVNVVLEYYEYKFIGQTKEILSCSSRHLCDVVALSDNRVAVLLSIDYIIQIHDIDKNTFQSCHSVDIINGQHYESYNGTIIQLESGHIITIIRHCYDRQRRCSVFSIDGKYIRSIQLPFSELYICKALSGDTFVILTYIYRNQKCILSIVVYNINGIILNSINIYTTCFPYDMDVLSNNSIAIISNTGALFIWDYYKCYIKKYIVAPCGNIRSIKQLSDTIFALTTKSLDIEFIDITKHYPNNRAYSGVSSYNPIDLNPISRLNDGRLVNVKIMNGVYYIHDVYNCQTISPGYNIKKSRKIVFQTIKLVQLPDDRCVLMNTSCRDEDLLYLLS